MRTKKKSRQAASETRKPEGYRPEVMFDLDGTLAKSVWPLTGPTAIGEPIPETVALLKQFAADGEPCSIWTSRPEDHRPQIMIWLIDNGLRDLIYRVVCEKPIYGLNVDDRSWCPPWLRNSG